MKRKRIGWMILILVLLVGCASYFSGVRLYYVQSGSMEPELPVGSLCIVTPCAVEELEVGDVIAFQNGPMQVAHRIVSIQEESYQTKGDANRSPDPGVVRKEQVQGQVIARVPLLGYLIAFLKSKAGIVLLVLLAGLFLFLAKRKERNRDVRSN